MWAIGAYFLASGEQLYAGLRGWGSAERHRSAPPSGSYNNLPCWILLFFSGCICCSDIWDFMGDLYNVMDPL